MEADRWCREGGTVQETGEATNGSQAMSHMWLGGASSERLPSEWQDSLRRAITTRAGKSGWYQVLQLSPYGPCGCQMPWQHYPVCEGGSRKTRWQHHSELQRSKVSRKGTVEGVVVDDILLDTGSARTLVKEDLVPIWKLQKDEVAIRCAHGDIATYPLASVEIEVGGKRFVVEAAVSATLPVSVLLGRDVPELVKMVKTRCGSVTRGKRMEEVMVTTRAQKKEQEREAKAQKERERVDGARPSRLWQLGNDQQNKEGPGDEVQSLHIPSLCCI